jgi:intein/homing endonuclease
MISTITQYEQDYIIEQYNNNVGATTIARKLRRSETFVKYNLKKLGIQLKKVKEGSYRKYTLNQHYFDIIDTQDKAYWLGFLYADGCNYEDRNELKLCLNINDSLHIHKFLTAIESNQPLVINAGNIRDNTIQVTICNGHFSRALAKQGCTKVKSFTIRFPILREDLISHFMRGYFDGDGCITGSHLHASFNITTNLMFAMEYQEQLVKYCNLTKTKLYVKNKDKSKEQYARANAMRYSGNHNLKRIYSFIYNNASIFLPRKKLKFEQILGIS